MYNEKIISRLKESIPQGLGISKNTTPIIYFGKYHNAQACTISLNPSDREFYDKNGDLLKTEKERLYSRKKLSKNDNEELSSSDCEKVILACEDYFQKNPYRNWFDKYEVFLNSFGYSFYDGSVVHLDIVQWATTPFWGELSNAQKNELLKKDLPFLEYLLRKNFEYIFLNGKTTVQEVSRYLSLRLKEKIVSYKGRNITIYTGLHNISPIIGWSPYIQSANVGGYEKIHELAKIIKEHVQ